MSFLGTRNAVAIGVSQHLTLGGPDLLSKLSPSLILQFAGAQTMDPRITFTRSTTATFTGSNGLLQTAAINTPRFDYDPVTLAPLGLLIEEQRTNLLTYSDQFDNAAWTKNASTVTTNAVISPNGTQDADVLIATATNAEHVCDQGFTATTGNTYTFSAYVKDNGLTDVGLRFTVASLWPGGASPQVRFNLTNGTASTISGTLSASSIQLSGNGWYRVSMSVICVANGTPSARIQLMSGVNNVFTGNGTDGITTWGAQLEAGAFPTSYIPTVASQVTRAADVAVMTGTNFSDWYNQTEGTLFAETQVPAFSATANPFLVRLAGANSSADRIEMFVAGASSNYRAEIRSSSVTQMLQNVVSGENLFDVNKFAIAYKENDSNSWGRFGNTTDTTVTVPTINVFDFGAAPVGVKYIRKIVYYPRRLSNAALQGITS